MNQKALDFYEEFNKLPDVDKWKLVKDNQDTGIIIYLDSDYTYGIIEGLEHEEVPPYIFEFDYFIGNSEGVFELLTAMGIKCDGV